jgi:hypothetical protein
VKIYVAAVAALSDNICKLQWRLSVKIYVAAMEALKKKEKTG